ncbi:unnamed protein product [Allacma fusca]|uniref:4-coumarate--CoA ligase n=1 Tax=Allacma fusca TaxID=39272 RepID=A0A8J2LRN6_9HEXA|nr:unnamed protein product [Allacma fusca]
MRSLPTRALQFAQLKVVFCRSASKTTTNTDNNILKPPTATGVDPVINSTLPEILWSNLSKFESLTAYECAVSGRKYTHLEIYKLSRSFGTSLLQSSLSRNDVVGVVLPNVPEYAIVMSGIWFAGLIATTLNPIYTQDELAHQLNLSGAKAVVTTNTLAPILQNVQRSKGSRVRSIMVVSKEAPPRWAHSFSDMIKTKVDDSVLMNSSGGFDAREHIAAIPFSSGTTGLPKGVMLTHSNLATNVLQFNSPGFANIKQCDGNKETQERMIGVLPFFHSYGMTCVMNTCTLRGAHCVTIPVFSKEVFIKVFREHQPTFINMVPPLLNVILNLPEFTKKEFESVDTIMLGAAPVGKALINQVLKKAEKFILVQEGYGMTESSPVSFLTPATANNEKLGSIGQPLPTTVAKIVDPKTGDIKSANEGGELCVKGPQVMKGYWQNEAATKDTIDKDGWLHTGDIGFFDNDGYVFLIDRIKELIKVKGFQVSPSELEDLLRRIPKVADCAVIGVNIDLWEAPRAYIVKKDESLTEEEVHTFLKEKAAPFKQLTGGIEFLKEIPKSAAGKILKRVLKKMYEEKKKLT